MSKEIIIQNNDIEVSSSAEQTPSQLSFITLSNNELAEIIRPEANLEKWQSFLFPHPKAKGLDGKRQFTYDLKLSDDKTVEASITTNPANENTSTTSRSYDVYLAIISLWDARGYPEEPFRTSIREIVKAMKVPQNGKWYAIVTEELERLYVTTISWTFSFKGESEAESVAFMKVLDTFKYVKFKSRANQTDKFEQVCVIRLSEEIRKNHKRQNTNPLLWSERKKITSPIAKIWYSKVDTILYGKSTPFERTDENIVDDLCLSKERYKYPSQRLTLLKKIQEQTDGKWLSSFRKLKVDIAKRADGKGYKLVHRGVTQGIRAQPNLPIANTDKALIKHLIDEISDVVGGKKENYKLYEMFCTYYSETLIRRAIGNYKEAGSYLENKTPAQRRAFFTATVHRIAHSMGKEWIKKCKPTCKYRKQETLL